MNKRNIGQWMYGCLILPILLAVNPLYAAQAQSAQAVIATPQQALDLVHEVLDTKRYGMKAYPAGCYDTSAEKRDEGLYVVHVTAKADQKCEIAYGESITSMSFEINSNDGAMVGIDLPRNRKQRKPILFDLLDEQGQPLLQEGTPYPWTLEGTTKRLRDTDECSLSYGIPAFERMNAYSFSLRAQKHDRALTMIYYVNSMYPPSYQHTTRGGIAVIRSTTDRIGVQTDHETLITYPADLVPNSRSWTDKVQTLNDVSFKVTVTGHDVRTLLGLLAKADVAITPILDDKTQSALTLSSNDFSKGVGKDLHVDAVAAFQRCLDVLWRD